MNNDKTRHPDGKARLCEEIRCIASYIIGVIIASLDVLFIATILVDDRLVVIDVILYAVIVGVGGVVTVGLTKAIAELIYKEV